MLHPSIDNRINPATKITALQPIINIVAKQQRLNPKKLSEYKKVIHFIQLSINHN